MVTLRTPFLKEKCGCLHDAVAFVVHTRPGPRDGWRHVDWTGGRVLIPVLRTDLGVGPESGHQDRVTSPGPRA